MERPVVPLLPKPCRPILEEAPLFPRYKIRGVLAAGAATAAAGIRGPEFGLELENGHRAQGFSAPVSGTGSKDYWVLSFGGKRRKQRRLLLWLLVNTQRSRTGGSIGSWKLKLCVSPLSSTGKKMLMLLSPPIRRRRLRW